MKESIINELYKITGLDKEELRVLIQDPPSSDLGDYSFPCFSLAKTLKKNPTDIAKELSSKIISPDFEKVVSNGPYINFFLDKKKVTSNILNSILTQKSKYGSSLEGKGKNIVIDLSSPNIAKPFGIGHLRSTIIGNSIANIYSSLGYNVIKINYLGDWGTQFGKLIVGYNKIGNKKLLKEQPIKHLLSCYVEGNKEEYAEESRNWFKKLEDQDKEALEYWKLFKSLSKKEFDKLYKLMNIKFDVISGESFYNDKMKDTIFELTKNSLLTESEGALGVDLNKYGLGFCLIKKSDGATLYATRDITAAIDRYNKYKFDKMIYEVGQEQKLHFQQIFKVIELLGHSFSSSCVHVSHGLYLGEDGKRFRTREGNTIYMEDVFIQAMTLAKHEILKREKLSDSELNKRAKALAVASIFYGDLKNFRVNDVIFDITRFVSFEGDTGPYLIYSYARAKSILNKAKYKRKKYIIKDITDKEKDLLITLGKYPEIIAYSAKNYSPNTLANYSFDIAQKFNEFYHSEQVIGSDKENFRLALVDAFSIVLKSSLNLLGIQTIEKM